MRLHPAAWSVACSLASVALAATDARAAVQAQRWHTTHLTFTDTGAVYAETGNSPNPFRDRRLTCTFTGPGGVVHVVQGFFAGNGTGGGTGAKFRCRFSFPAQGAWTYAARFCAGSDVALNPSPAHCPTDRSGALAEARSGSVEVAASDKAPPDFREQTRGWVRNPSPGKHAFEFAGGAGAFVKAGLNLGEGFLGYRGFDNTTRQCNASSGSQVKTYAAHAADWRAGDPDWSCSGCQHPAPSRAGREIIGALNYIAGGFNAKYMMLLSTPDGDTCDVYPYVSASDPLHFDVSKLDQWEIVFEHAQRLGVCLHLAFGEQEINDWLDGGALGVERKLFYKEMVARFAHHPCVQWNLGEEQTYWKTAGRIPQFADYFKSLDPYDHPLAAHTNTGDTAIAKTHEEGMRAGDDVDGTSLQGTWNGYPGIWDAVRRWRGESAANGFPWVVSLDETKNLSADGSTSNPVWEGRTERMWPWLLSGGLGFEWYVMADGDHDLDPRVDDFHVVSSPRDWTRFALETFAQVDAARMSPFPPRGSGRIATASGSDTTWTLALRGREYLLYNTRGGAFTLDLSDAASKQKTFDVTFVDPADGSSCVRPAVAGGGASTPLGTCQCSGSAACSGDVLVLVRESGLPGPTVTTTTTTTTTTAQPPTTLPPSSGIGLEEGSVRSACSGSAADGITIPNVTVTSRPDRMLIVTVGAEEDDRDCDLAGAGTVVTYAGRTLARAVAAVSDTSGWRACNGIFYLAAPPVGTADVVVKLPATMGDAIDNRQAGAMLLYNVAQGPPEAVAASGADATTNPVTASVVARTQGAWAVDVVTQGETGTFAALAAGQVEQWKPSCGSSASATSTKIAAAPGTATTFTWSHTRPRRYAHARAAFAPASAAPECAVDADCSDADACTADRCLGGSCSHEPECSQALVVDTQSVRSLCSAVPADSLVLPAFSVAAGADRVLVVTVGAESDDPDCNLASSNARVTYGSRTLSRATAAVSDTSSWRACSGIFYLLNPPAGTADLTVTFPSASGGAMDARQMGAFVLHNAAQTAPLAVAAAGKEETASIVTNAISVGAAGAVVVDVITQGNVGSFSPRQAGQGERYEVSCETASAAASTRMISEPGTAAMGWQHTDPRRWAHALAAFAPAP